MPETQRNVDFSRSLRLVSLCLEVHDTSRLNTLLSTLHIADLADILEDLSLAQRSEFIETAKTFLNAELLLNVHESYRQQVIELLGFEHFRPSLQDLSNEDIFSLIEAFDELTQEQFLTLLPPLRQKSVRLFLNYPESSVGRYMSVDFLKFHEADSVDCVLKAAQQDSNLPENFSEVFIVDQKGHPMGTVFLKDLLNAPKESMLTTFVHRDVLPITASSDKKEASALFSKYRCLRVPVVDEKGSLVGILRSDNILDIVFDENSERILDIGGMPSEHSDDPFWPNCFSRLRWIIVMVLNASLSPLVIQTFNNVIEQVSYLASLMPLVASIGGVVGIQSVSVVIKEFAEGNLRAKHFGKPIFREVSMGLLNGLVIGLIVGGAAALWRHDIKIGVVLGLAMLTSMIWGAFAGTALPILASRLGFDSALCSGPIVTTLTDVSGFAIFLTLAKLILI